MQRHVAVTASQHDLLSTVCLLPNGKTLQSVAPFQRKSFDEQNLFFEF